MKQFILLCAILSLEFKSLLLASTTIPKVGFDQSMESTPMYKRAEISPELKKVKTFYETNFIRQELPTELKIPKIIHQVWLGSPFPEKYEWLRDSWLRHNPDWEYRLWTEKEVEEFGLSNQKLYDTATNYGEKSDIVRYEVLYRFGGLYVDTDFECLKCFDEFNYYCDFYSGLGYGTDCYVYLALIGSRPGHPILKLCIDGLKQQEKLTDRSDKTILNRTGPNYFSSCIKQYLPFATDRVVLFPVTYFYPWPYFHRKENSREQIEAWFRPETCAVHHWYVSWAKR